MDIKSVNSGSARLDKLQNDNLQKKADDTKSQQNAAATKQRQDRLELSSEATLRNQAVKANATDNKKIEQKLKQYDQNPDSYKQVAQKLNRLIPVTRQA